MFEGRNDNRVAVVGGGVIGLSVAWQAARAGWSVRLIDPDPGSGASWIAGGMLAPVTEGWPGEESVLDLGAHALAAWPAFAAELAEMATDPALRTEGTLVVAFDAADREQLDRLADHLASLGREVTRLTGSAVRALEPSIAPSVRSGLSVRGDLSVDNRKLLHGLREAAATCGVEFVARTAVAVRPGAVELADGSTLDCDVVVVSAGAWSRDLHPALSSLVRPVKGEILRLGARRSTVPLVRTVRALVESRPVYLVPRAGGEVVLGATQYEAGFDTGVTVAGVRDLLADAERVMPGVAEYTLLESAAGPRAGSKDNLPVIGWLEPGVLVATGHHRNGLLLAPTTAKAVTELLAGQPLPESARAAGVDRFSNSVPRKE